MDFGIRSNSSGRYLPNCVKKESFNDSGYYSAEVSPIKEAPPPTAAAFDPDRDLSNPINENDVVYEGGGSENGSEVDSDSNDEMDTSMMNEEENQVEVDANGVKYKIPYSLPCHLCNEAMYLCVRRTRYRGEPREYPAYRCNRKGCQTFRSIRKLFTGEKLQPSSIDSLKEQLQVAEKNVCVEKVQLPRYEKKFTNGERQLTMTERMRKANQERATMFTEFSDQLRKDIAANKRIRSKNMKKEDDQQGTLLYITKELTPNEIVELQDEIVKVLMSMKKIPIPMTMNDLPLFANCPWSKSQVENGLQHEQSREAFLSAFTNAPQPPLPEGFIRRKDDTLLYKDPKPTEVPEHLKENSPRKTAEAIISYNARKSELEARKFERKFSEKKQRAWKSLKREFDTAEAKCADLLRFSDEDLNGPPATKKSPQSLTIQSIMSNMGSSVKCVAVSGTIRVGFDKKESMQWFDTNEQSLMAKSSLAVEYSHRKHSGGSGEGEEEKKIENTLESISLHEMMIRSISAPPQLSNSLKSSVTEQSSTFDASLQNLMQRPSTPINYNSYPYEASMAAGYPYTNWMADFDYNTQNMMHSIPSMNPTEYPPCDYLYQNSSATSVSDFSMISPYTYVNPQSGAQVTDPSAFLTSFIPSPLAKTAPITFGQNSSDGKPSAEEEKSVVIEKEDQIHSPSEKFDPPNLP